MPAPTSLAGFPKLIYKHIQSLQVRSIQCHIWCHVHGHHTTHGVTGAVVAPCMVLWALLSFHIGVAITIIALCVVLWSPSLFLCCMWYRSRGCCTIWVLQVPSLRHVWCCGCGHCATCGVGVRVVALHVGCHCCLCATCGVTVMVIVPRVGRTCCLCAVCGIAVMVAVIVLHGAAAVVIVITLLLDHKRGS